MDRIDDTQVSTATQLVMIVPISILFGLLIGITQESFNIMPYIIGAVISGLVTFAVIIIFKKKLLSQAIRNSIIGVICIIIGFLLGNMFSSPQNEFHTMLSLVIFFSIFFWSVIMLIFIYLYRKAKNKIN